MGISEYVANWVGGVQVGGGKVARSWFGRRMGGEVRASGGRRRAAGERAGHFKAISIQELLPIY